VELGPQQIDWLVGPPLDIRSRLCFTSPSGANPITPDEIRQRCLAENRHSTVVIWRIRDRGIGGLRVGIDEVAWHDSDISHFETSFCRPAKGPGDVCLSACNQAGGLVSLIVSDHYDESILQWHMTIGACVEQLYPGLTRIRDGGCDA